MNPLLDCCKARDNAALLEGLLVCGGCGDYMHPKLSGKANEGGERTYCYVCRRKEESNNALCKIKNPNGTLLDAMVIDTIKNLAEDKNELVRQLEKNRRLLQDGMDTGDTDLTKQHKLECAEIDMMSQKLSSFAANVDEASVEEKRVFIRILVEKVVWDGENITVYLFGTEDPAASPEEPQSENCKQE